MAENNYSEELEEFADAVLIELHDMELLGPDNKMRLFLDLVSDMYRDEFGYGITLQDLAEDEEMESQYYSFLNEVTTNILGRAIAKNRNFVKKVR